MLNVHVKITGLTPLLMHADNIEWSDAMDEWRKDPSNKAMSKAGDDRTPPWRWIGSLNTDGKIITIPSEYIMGCMMAGGAQVPTGSGKKTFKAQSQSGLLCPEFHWPLHVNGSGATVSMADVNALKDGKLKFSQHSDRTRELGFALFVKRAKVGQSKHVRVRPRFDQWSTEGRVAIIDEAITPKVLQQILDIAGRYKGLGDWRPGGKTPGQFGMFEAVVTED
jgi:hypothetical protein